jgi:Trypsin-co-occurring domain 2
VVVSYEKSNTLLTESGSPDSSELSIFISEALQAIMSGVAAAQPKATASSDIQGTSFLFGFHSPSEVSFDIAVTAKKSETSDKGLKLEVFSVGANAKGEKGHENSTVSRVAFTIPAIPMKVQTE